MNYFQAHKNKDPKKAKYSKPYTKQQIAKIKELQDLFDVELAKINDLKTKKWNQEQKLK